MTNCRALLKVGLDAIYHRLLLVIIIMPGVNSKDALNQRLQLRHLYIYKENYISYKYCAFPSHKLISFLQKKTVLIIFHNNAIITAFLIK